jgi:hypothetical protein
MYVRVVRPLVAALLLAAAACGAESSAPSVVATEGLIKREYGWVLRTPTLRVEPNEERYVCYAVLAPRDMAINRFASDSVRAVHHFQLNEATVNPVQDGLSDCETFPTDWSPLYTATTVAAELETPAGSARFVKKGAQLVLQTHLLNVSSEPVEAVLEIEMGETAAKALEPVGILGFGSANILLPPKSTTTIENTCRIPIEMRTYEIVPHMHFLGRRAELELGPDENSLEPVYVREPFDFNDQYFDPFVRTIPAGTVARVRCTYDNDTDRTVHYGESSRDEMCNVAAFVVGQEGVGFCSQESTDPDRRVPREPGAGLCGFTQSPSGIGKLCSQGGNECGEELYCTADALRTARGICVQIGCNSNADCDGAVCCTQAGVGAIANVCTPEACRPDDCIPVELR